MESAAVSGAQWVVGKALSPLSDGLVEAWAASSELGPNIEALKMELLYAQAMLENARGREIRSLALAELLQRLRGLAYGAEDALDELDYFRIQDELEGTFETVDGDGRGCVHDLTRDARHTAKAASKQLGCATSCFSAARGAASDPYNQEHGARKRGLLCRAWPRGSAGEESCKCVRRLASRARTTAHAVGKQLLCSSLLPVRNHQGDDSTHTPRVPKLKFDRVDVSRRMKCIVEQLQPVCAKVSTILDLELLGSIQLQLLDSSRRIGNDPSSSRPITTSRTIEFTLYGRDPEKNKIVEDMTKGSYTHRDLTVIPIVGPGGIGKTTLTQYIYNSQEVQDHFQIRVWICVSLDFSVYRLTKEILNSLPKANDEKNDQADDKIQNLDQLQKLVEKRVKNKRFLLVLDDIWKYGNDEEWKRWLVPFENEHEKGNIVLVTTRFLEVAEMVRTTDKLLHLEGLKAEEYWSLFVACVFDDTNEQYKYSSLLVIGKKIVKKLKGSPLAAKTVGRLLKTNLTIDHWTRVLESKEWESQTNDHDIMPALKLSYDYLPFHLQQCFSYCALFPEDYKFDWKKLIRFWIGLDILRLGHRTKRIEDIGLDNLNELVNYGFFKKETGDFLDTHYVMHDLLHDLAVKVSSPECLHIVSSSPRPVEISPSIYHLSISMSSDNSEDGIIEENFRKELGKIRNRLKAENLHTLMLFGEFDETFVSIFSDLFKDAKSLRVVHLPAMPYPLDSILHNFSKLVHLRYLSIASGYDNKEQLPTSLSRFYHLRVLDMEKYRHVNKWHGDMTSLVKLRHFLVPFLYLHMDIPHVGKLHNLQELTSFKVRKGSNGFDLRELGKLEEIGGSLSIYNLENVQVNEAHEAKLLYKNRLQRLTLNWMWMSVESNRNPDIEGQVLEGLRPHSNLLELCIEGHGGLTCPTWLGTNLSVKGLEALHLIRVGWKVLPPLGELWLIGEPGEERFGCITGPNFQNLKTLELTGLPKLRKWVAKAARPVFFSLLEKLIVDDCPELTELPFSPEGDETATCFPKLVTVTIKKCPKLLSLPPIPYVHTLRDVDIMHVGRGLEKLIYSNRTMMSLDIEGDDALHNLYDTVLAFHNLTQLQSLCLKKCPPIAEEHLQILTSLKTLVIDGATNVFPVLARGDVKWQLPVNHLMIKSCGASGKELTQLLSHLPELSELFIDKCEKITRLVVKTKQQETTASILLPSSAAAKLEDTRGADQQQEIAQEVEGEEVAEQLVVEQQREEEDGLLLLGAHLSETLQWLVIFECSELILTAQSSETGRGLQALSSLKKMNIVDSPKFLSAYKASGFSSCCPFPSSLQHLSLWGRMEGMETLAPFSNLISVDTLYFYNWGDDLRCEGLWPLLTRGQLTRLDIYGTFKFFVGWDVTWGLLDERDQLLTSSKPRELRTDDVAGVLAAPICITLSSFLTKLVFDRSMVFDRNMEMESFTRKQEEALSLVTSLQELVFDSFYKLQCLPTGLNKLTNLKRLAISSCPAIKSLPKNGLPSSLQELDVSYCRNEELKKRCRQLIGTIPKIKLQTNY